MEQRQRALFLVATIFLASCAGRTPNPVSMYSPGDDALSCEGLRIQMGYCQERVATLLPKSDKTGSNVALGIAGAFLLVPFFFMDFSEADKIEMEAWRARNNYLTSLFVDKGCGKRIMMPSVKQMRKDEALRDKWAEQVEVDQEFLHHEQAETFAELDEAAKESNTSLSHKLQSMEESTPASVLRLSEQEYISAKDRLLSLYTAGDIDKVDFDRELKQLGEARSAYKQSEGGTN